MKIYEVINQMSTNPSLSSNGGDYTDIVYYLVDDNQVVGIQHTTTWDGGCCCICGRYSHNGENCCGYVEFNVNDHEEATSGRLLVDNDDLPTVKEVTETGWYNETCKYKIVDYYGWTFYMSS